MSLKNLVYNKLARQKINCYINPILIRVVLIIAIATVIIITTIIFLITAIKAFIVIIVIIIFIFIIIYVIYFILFHSILYYNYFYFCLRVWRVCVPSTPFDYCFSPSLYLIFKNFIT